MGKKLNIALLMAAISYFGFAPAPPNAPGYVITSVTVTLVRAIFGLGMFLNSFEITKKYGLLVGRGASAPSPKIDSVDEEIVDLGDFNIHIFTPQSYEGGHGAIIAYHGGGWVVGNVESMATFYSNIADQAGTVVVAANYRLAPENKYPAAIFDAYATVKYVYENAENLKIDYAKTVITGDSAGGHLTLVTALNLVDTEYQVAGIFPVHPVTQGATLDFRSHHSEDKYLLSRKHMAWFYSQFLTGSDKRMNDWLSGKILRACLFQSNAMKVTFDLDEQIYPEDVELEENTSGFREIVKKVLDYRISPLFAPLDMLIELPPTVIYVGEHDILHDDGVLMFKLMEDIGHVQARLVEWEGSVHDGGVLSAQWVGQDLVPEATKWVNEYIKDMRKITD